MLFIQFHCELNIFLDFKVFEYFADFNGTKRWQHWEGKTHLGTQRGFILSTPSERVRFRLQITAIKFLGYAKSKILKRQTKVTQRSNYSVPCHAFRTLHVK